MGDVCRVPQLCSDSEARKKQIISEVGCNFFHNDFVVRETSSKWMAYVSVSLNKIHSVFEQELCVTVFQYRVLASNTRDVLMR